MSLSTSEDEASTLQKGLHRRTYKAILELAARHPMLNAKDIALLTGATEKWVHSIMKSDAFRAQRAARFEELHGDRLAEIRAKMEQTTSLLVDAIAKRIADPEAAVTEDTVLKAAALLLDRVLPAKQPTSPTPGNPSGATPTVNISFNGITAEDIQRARQNAMAYGHTLQLEAQTHLPETITDVDEDGLPTERRLRSNEGLD